ncbi:MAG TPA: hypothetical protein VGG20_12955 [Thermoanaerobaculia bacterium]
MTRRAGALEESEYRRLLAEVGFERIEIEKTRISDAEDARQAAKRRRGGTRAYLRASVALISAPMYVSPSSTLRMASSTVSPLSCFVTNPSAPARNACQA